MKLSRHGRVWTATLLWVAVAAMLIYRGIVPHFSNIEGPTAKVLAIVLGVVIGGAKGFFVLRKSATRTAGFIKRRPERDWIWMSVHPVLYAVIPLMIGMGWALRHYLADSHPAVVTGVYVGIGAALLTSVSGFRAALRD